MRDTETALDIARVHEPGFDARIGNAERALAALDTAVRALPNAREVCDAGLRRAAMVTSGIDGSKALLPDLFLVEAGSPLSSRSCTRPDHGDAPEVMRANRHVEALSHGRQRLEIDATLTKGLVLEILSMLVGVARADEPEALRSRDDDSGPGNARASSDVVRREPPIPAVVMGAFAELDAVMRTVGARHSSVVGASMARECLSRLEPAMPDCRALSRVAALLLLRAGDRPFLSLPSSLADGEPRKFTAGIDAAAPSDTGGRVTGYEGDDDIAARFADGIAASAGDALSRLRRIADLTGEDERRIGALSKAAHSARRVHVALQRWPVIALPRLVEETGLGVQAVTFALHRLRPLGIVREITGRHRHRVYSYDAYLELLGEGLG